MTHFAALYGIGRPVHTLARAAGMMQHSVGGASAYATQDHRVMQWGAFAQHGPLSLCGDLGLTDIAQLRDDAQAKVGASPAQMILSLWARFGEQALHRLHGCFAFVLHDSRSGEVWAVRDRMGVRPLAYALEADRIVIASTIRTVRAGLSAPTDIDAEWVADFLSGQDTSRESTAHAQIRRLPPGHLLRFTPDGALSTRIWYDLSTGIRPARADGAEALQHALRHATREVCSGRAIATFLSGGLDSSTLSLLGIDGARKMAALSLRYDDPTLDEGTYINAVLQRASGGLVPLNLKASEVRPDVMAMLDEQDQPVFAPGLPGNRHLYAASRHAGYHDILDGHGGDEVIDGGLWTLAQMAGAGAWTSAMTLGWQHSRFMGIAPWGIWGQLVAARGPGPLAALARRAMRAQPHDTLEWRALLDPALVSRTDLVARVQARHSPTVGDLPETIRAHLSVLTAPLLAGALEILDTAARSAGVTPHYPFYDHRVVELCLAQPAALRIADGQPRSLLRRAMQGVLPDSVRLRRDKVDFLPDFWASLRRDRNVHQLLADPQSLQGWVNIATLQADGQRLKSDTPHPVAAFRISRALALATWLEARASAAPNLQHKAS